jgi:hypothetical protein
MNKYLALQEIVWVNKILDFNILGAMKVIAELKMLH